MQTLYTIKEALRINGYRRYQLLGEVEKLIHYMEKIKLDHYLTSSVRVNSRGVKKINVKKQTIK